MCRGKILWGFYFTRPCLCFIWGNWLTIITMPPDLGVLLVLTKNNWLILIPCPDHDFVTIFRKAWCVWFVGNYYPWDDVWEFDLSVLSSVHVCISIWISNVIIVDNNNIRKCLIYLQLYAYACIQHYIVHCTVIYCLLYVHKWTQILSKLACSGCECY